MNKRLNYQYVKFILPLIERLNPDLAAELGFRLFCTPPEAAVPLASAEPVLAAAERRRVQVDAEVVQLYRWSVKHRGPQRQKQQIFLIHGWGTAVRDLHAIVGKLLLAGFDVVAFDLPAHGLSSGSHTTLSDCLRALQVVHRAAGPAYALVGHGFGGAVAALATVPESHLATISGVERLVLIGAPDRFSAVLDRFGKKLALSEPALERLKVRAGHSLGGPVECFSTGSAVWAAQLPVLVMHDQSDPDVPHEDGRAVAAVIEQGIFISTDEGQRSTMLQSARVAREVVNFLRVGEKKVRIGPIKSKEVRSNTTAVQIRRYSALAQ